MSKYEGQNNVLKEIADAGYDAFSCRPNAPITIGDGYEIVPVGTAQALDFEWWNSTDATWTSVKKLSSVEPTIEHTWAVHRRRVKPQLKTEADRPGCLADGAVVETNLGPMRIDPKGKYYSVEPSLAKQAKAAGYGRARADSYWGSLPASVGDGYRVLCVDEKRPIDCEFWNALEGRWCCVDAKLIGHKIDAWCCIYRTPIAASVGVDQAKGSSWTGTSDVRPDGQRLTKQLFEIRLAGRTINVTVELHKETEINRIWRASWTTSEGVVESRLFGSALDRPPDFNVLHRVVRNVEKPDEERAFLTIHRMKQAKLVEAQERLAKILPGPGTDAEWGEP